MENFTEMLINFLANNPNMAIVLSIMVVSRAVFKPTCSMIQAYVDATESKSDNEKWAAIQEKKWFKALAYAMDFLLSIKIPKRKE